MFTGRRECLADQIGFSPKEGLGLIWGQGGKVTGYVENSGQKIE